MNKFIIKSIDLYNDKNYEIVLGEKINENDNIIYRYKSKLGECTIIFNKNNILVERDGDFQSKLDIRLNEYTDFYYKNENFKKLFKIKGEYIKFDEILKIVEFSYKIFDNNEEINQITFTIKSL